MIIPYNPAPFEVEVADRTIGQTVVKQKALFTVLEHNDPARTCTVKVLITPYALAADGGYGEVLNRPPFSSYEDTIVASNSRLVDARTGAILAERKPFGTPNADADWQADIARIEASPVPARYQGDFFMYLRDHEPLVIGNVIRQYIQQADAHPSRYA